jgi:hypothetical protein
VSASVRAFVERLVKMGLSTGSSGESLRCTGKCVHPLPFVEIEEAHVYSAPFRENVIKTYVFFFSFLRTCIENLDAKCSCIRMEILCFFFPWAGSGKKKRNGRK